jgi:chain length determinant protein EpsF
MTVAQVIEVLRARWRLAGGAFALVLGLAMALTLLLPRQYTAGASVVIDVKSADPIAGVTSPALTAPSYMATQVDIMESDRVAQQVVRALKMNESADMRRQWSDDTGGSGNFEIWLAGRLRRKLDVRPARESNVIEVRFTSADGRFAAAVANAFAQAYLGILLELRTDPARRYSAFFDERARQLRDELERAQRQLSAFQRQHSILSSEERLDVETARMNDLSSQLVGLQAASADSRSRDVAAATAGGALQDIIANPVVAGLRTELAKQESRLLEMSERFGERHPQYLEQRAAIEGLRARIEQETRRVASSLQIGSIISESRESQVRAALESQRERMLRMKGERNELAVLQRDAELAQRAYDGVVARLSQVSLESQSTQTNAALLTEATEPSQASFPRWSVNLPLGFFAGVLAALGAALAREASDRRVRTRDDVLRGLRLPVLGTLLASPQGPAR